MTSLVFCMVLATPEAAAWGPTGHRVVAEIAWQQVSPKTRRALGKILGAHTLAERSTWPDWIRSDPTQSHTAPRHYMSIPDDGAVGEPEEPHILWAIEQAEVALADTGRETSERLEALSWLVHLVGDVHQPLHVGRSDDRGGNMVFVEWMGRQSNLHHVWDEDMIDFEQWSYTELASLLGGRPAPAAWSTDPPTAWAQESFELRSMVYDIGDSKLAWEYRYRAWPVVERRLQQAGVRLAARLDALL